MKKAFALLLALALLIPMGLIPTVNAEGEVTVQPFYVLGWSDFNNNKYPYLDGLVTSNFKNIGDKAQISYGGATVQYGSYTDADVEKFAQAMKKTMDARPEGLRYWHLFGPAKIMKLAPQNALFMDFGVNQLTDLTTAVLKKMSEIGCPLDGVVIDTEYVGMGVYYLIDANTEHQSNNYTKNPNLLKQIVADPRYATEIRPLLEEYGFIFYDAGTPEKQAQYTELFSLTKGAGSKYAQSRLVWNTVTRIHLNRYADKWVYAPLKQYYPNASLSDYQSADSATWMKMAAVTDDGIVMDGGNSTKVGNTSSFSYYYSRPNSDFYKNNNKYSGYNDAIFAPEAFSNLIYDINFTRHMYYSSDTKQIAPWITYYSYGGKQDKSMAYTPYYSELLYHLGMFDPEPFLSYTYVGDSCFKDGRESSTHYHEIQQVKNELMAELTRVAGFSDRKVIPMPMNWNSKFILSGMYANGRNIWRITPNTSVVSLENFKVEGADPTFYVNGETVTFPGGKIIEDTTISIVGSCGYWVETAKDVTPIVTSDPDRYEKFPALHLDFDALKEGKFDYNTMYPTGAWEFTWKKGGKSEIVAVDGNNKLALTGNSSNRLINLPNNVTAGDTYAEDQAWQATVTIPEGLAANAEIVLLNYAGNKQKTADGGFKIAGGKVYYSENGEYKELMAIQPGTYTFKRIMDFTNLSAIASTYTVLDAAGKELKTSAKVSVPGFNYITNIALSTTDADKAVLIDDLKLMVIGTTLDFGLYDGKTGQKVVPDTVRPASTAYRLSWMNATAKDEVATLKADIYEGETLKETKVIKEIKMQPGYDGIETGIVEVAQGQSVKVYLDTNLRVDYDKGVVTEEEPTVDPTTPDATTAPTTPGASDPTQGATEGTGTTGTEKGGNNTMMIAVIAVVVVAVVAIVLALVLTKKKPVKKEEN